MIEYLYNAIRATSGDDITIAAKITTDSGAIITDTCSLCLYDEEKKIFEVEGRLEDNVWNFTINGEATAALAGRYWYKVCDCEHNSLNFKLPIYFIAYGGNK